MFKASTERGGEIPPFFFAPDPEFPDGNCRLKDLEKWDDIKIADMRETV